MLRTATAALLLLATLSTCQSSAPRAAQWSYEGDTGPEHWADLDPAYALAKTGRSQSPIDIAGGVAAGADPIEADYHPTTVDVVNNGHTIEDDYHAGGSIIVGGHEYTLAQLHFHSPSEHMIEGKQFPAEMHLVHRDANGKLAVIGVMIEVGQENSQFKRLEGCLPKEPGRAKHVEGLFVNARDLLPESLASFHYSGSLTSPPCSEGVAWFVLREPIRVSEAQLAAFRELYFGNNRPTQPLHDRVITAAK